MSSGRICLADFEADGLLEDATQIWCAVFKDRQTGEVFKFHPGIIPTWEREMRRFMDNCDVLVMHNGVQYDLPLLRKLYGYEFKGKVVDTMLMSRLQMPNRTRPMGCSKGPNSIEAWGMRLGRHKPEHEDWSQYSTEMLHRCVEDVEILDLTLTALLEEGRGVAWKPAHVLTSKLFEVLQLQDEAGWLVDQELIHKYIHQLTRWMDKIDKAAYPYLPYTIQRPSKIGGRYAYYKNPFTKAGKPQKYIQQWLDRTGYDNPSVIGGPFSAVQFSRTDLGSNSQTKAFLLEEGWKPQQWNYKDGERTSPKLNHDEEFIGINGTLGRLIARRVQCRHRRSQLQGWLDNLRPDGRVSQKISGIAATGRLTHKGIVNVPGGDTFFGKQMRKVFIAKPGYKIVGVDSDACQLRMLASRMGDDEYTEAVINGDKDKGTDIHSVNMRKAGLSNRAQAKTFIYALLFGGGDAKIGSIVQGNARDGKVLRDRFLSALPRLKALIESLTDEWRSNAKVRRGRWGPEYYDGWFIGLDGRRVYCSSEHMVLVYALQSDEAIMLQTAQVTLYEWLQERGWKHGQEYSFVACVHDEYSAEVREDLAEEYKELAEEAIAYAGRQLNIACPHVGGGEIGNNWYEVH